MRLRARPRVAAVSVIKTVFVAALAGAVLGPLAVWAMHQQNATEAAPPPSWFRDTVGVVCAGCGPQLAAGHGQVVAGWRHPGTGETLAVGLGHDGQVDRYDLHGPRHTRAHAVAVSPSGLPALLLWDGRALELTQRARDGWQQPRPLTSLTVSPTQLQLVFSGRDAVAGWIADGRLTVLAGGHRTIIPAHGQVRSFELEGGASPAVVWQDGLGAAAWSAGRTVRLGPTSAPPQLAGRFVVWRDGADIHLATVTGSPETIASGTHSPVAAATAGGTVMVADQEQHDIVLRTLHGRRVAVQRFPLAPHATATSIRLAVDRNGSAALVWQENGAMVKALARPQGKPWSARPSELTRRDETAVGVQLADDGAGRFAVVWDNHGFIGETVEFAEIDLGSS